MRRLLAVGVVGILGMAAGGCEEPTRIVPVGAPGTEVAPKAPDESPAEAIGEAGKYLPTEKKGADIPPAPPTAKGEIKKTPSGVSYETIKPGTGDEVKVGQMVRVHYVGTLENGEKFDSSRDSDRPFSFAIGAGNVIRGWDEGVPGMKVGEVRRLTIPASAAYGEDGRPPKIPGGATLHFEIEVLGIE